MGCRDLCAALTQTYPSGLSPFLALTGCALYIASCFLMIVLGPSLLISAVVEAATIRVWRISP
jgi:hypothetical protein